MRRRIIPLFLGGSIMLLVACSESTAPTTGTQKIDLKPKADGWECPLGSTWSVRSGVEGCWPIEE